ncbi:MAG: hypothetical protein GXY46_04695 [Actinobacteria bacterium]|nr:hypothetical protein [Actinomycetota bacterium]
MLISVLTGVAILLAAVGYVVFRKFSVTRQAIEFGAPQNGVAAIYLDIREDTVRSLHILYEDGTVSEVRKLEGA